MNNKDLREPKYCHIFFHAVNGFAFWTFIPTVLHFFRGSITAYTFIYIDVARVSDGFSRDWNGKVHKVVEGQRLVLAYHALQLATKLPFEQICYYWVVASTEILVPDFRLLIHRFSFTIYFLVRRLLHHAIQLVVHAVQKEPQELLGILLAVAGELSGYTTHLVLECARCDVAALSISRGLEKVAITETQILISKFLVGWESPAQKVFG